MLFFFFFGNPEFRNFQQKNPYDPVGRSISNCIIFRDSHTLWVIKTEINFNVKISKFTGTDLNSVCFSREHYRPTENVIKCQKLLNTHWFSDEKYAIFQMYFIRYFRTEDWVKSVREFYLDETESADTELFVYCSIITFRRKIIRSLPETLYEYA